MSVEPASKNSPMSIFLKNQNGTTLYRESFGLSPNTAIESAGSIDAIKNTGLAVIT